MTEEHSYRMHQHYYDIEGHVWQCAGKCQCICGLPMEGKNHFGCPVELLPCPEHIPKAERRLQRARTELEDVETIFRRLEREATPLHCECGWPALKASRLQPIEALRIE